MLVLARDQREGNNELILSNGSTEPIVLQPGEVLGSIKIAKSNGVVRLGIEMPKAMRVLRGELEQRQPVELPTVATVPVRF